MNPDAPLAYFITWTIYGVHLQGDSRGWRKRKKGEQPPQPLLQEWHASRLKFPIRLLQPAERDAAENACLAHADHRAWKLWAVNARTNHIHAVVAAPYHKGTVVRDQLKANCTRVIRDVSEEFANRPVWAVGGDVEFIHATDDLDAVIDYTLIAQDRKYPPPREPQGASPGSVPNTHDSNSTKTDNRG